MDAVLNDTIYIPITTKDPTTGNNLDATGTSLAISIYEEGTGTAMGYSGGTIVNRAEEGSYAVPVVLSAANGFEADKWYEVWAVATLSGTAYGPEPIEYFKVVEASALGELGITATAFYANGNVNYVDWSNGRRLTYAYAGGTEGSISTLTWGDTP